MPRVFDALVVECCKRAGVTYAALLLTGPPLSLGDDPGLVDAARLCISDDIDSLRSLFAAWEAPRASLDALCEMLATTCVAQLLKSSLLALTCCVFPADATWPRQQAPPARRGR